ncbi:serine hydrolase [Aeromicrobium sp. CTD01-1L150]|uniref:serine hydrolase n=1 Tax=Aeromicrobium sp. CTD01-1L150 TaxID=3341830 RepID=UPI0035C17B15
MRLPELTPDAQWSVCVRDAATSQVLLEHRADAVLHTASIGKLFLLVEIAALAESGVLDLAEELERTPGDDVADSGIWYLMSRGALAVGDLCWLVGGFSDNLATNVLMRRIGIAAVTERSRGLGFTHSALLDRVRDDRRPTDPPTLSRGNAGELSELMARLHRGEVISPAVSAQVLRWVAVNADLSMTAAAFGLDPLAHTEPDRGLTLVNKTGTTSTVRGDVGLVRGPAGGLAYAVLAGWEDGVDPRDRVLTDMRRLGDLVREHLTAGPTSPRQSS